MTDEHTIFSDYGEARAFRAFQANLVKASNTADVGRAVTDVVRKTIGVSGVVYYPLHRGATPDGNVVLYSEFVDRETAARGVVTTFPKAEQELGFISSYLRDTKRTRR